MASQSGTQCPKPRKLTVLSNYEKAVRSAFKWDCETFLEQFEKANSLKYADFANIWQLNNFTYVYVDQTFVSPLKVLCDVCFMTVKKYFMFQNNLYTKVGAFYLLYGLYYKQPIRGMVKIRLTLAEYREIKLLMNEMASKGQYDIVYIFVKMKSDNVFLYTAEPKPFNIELTKSVKSLAHLDDTFQTRGTESSLRKFRNMLEDETVQALQKTCSEYDSLLQKFAAKHPSITKFKSTIINDLKEAHSKSFADSSTESNIIVRKSPEKNMPNKNLRQMIRLKAMQTQNAEYRGSKNVLTAIDLEDEEEETLDDDYTPIKSPRRRRKGRAKRGKR